MVMRSGGPIIILTPFLKGMTVQGKEKTIQLMKDILRRSKAEQTEVILLGTDEQLTRFANNEIHQNVSETNVTITVRVAQGKRVGMATANDLSPDGLDRVVQMAQDVVAMQPENPDFPGFPDPPIAHTHAGCIPAQRFTYRMCWVYEPDRHAVPVEM